ncbi:TIGR01459 family HAD-type hydrolase [Phaeovibrio sulfidiphilus]|uniref:TIGR01459 family HAD-type hydrolase n=1 Tax=Phaeovibrio sulfidiphilus TaxID=1220600 RepID=A0A8J7CDM9_9PROT|nr:TIGR01459 family HAD-type hydrolase [Phaeovibrio sulfidiphilus]MBE1237159.1 TIGR01459 family HAD-type hydrolase [Phaeovibrio sulfidiphilus]
MTALSAGLPLFPRGLAEIAGDYDAILLDLWGVVHDGERPYPGAVDTLEALARLSKPVCLLSNAPRLGGVVVEAMERMGIARSLYTAILTSGDVVNHALVARSEPEFRALGDRCFFIGPERDWNLLDGTGIAPVTREQDADFVLCTGPVDLTETEEDYRPVLEACARRRLPMVCANPDKAVVRAGKRVMCAGALASVYESLGCPVIWRGKPEVHIFHEAVRLLLGDTGSGRVLMVGDGLHTDIPGARDAGIDAAFVAGGLNAADLGTRHGDRPDPARVLALLDAHGLSPRVVLPALVWQDTCGFY